MHLQVIQFKETSIGGDRWYVRLELFRQFKCELSHCRLRKGLVFEKKKFRSNGRERGIPNLTLTNLTLPTKVEHNINRT